MRLKPSGSTCRRMVHAFGFLMIAALCCTFFPPPAHGYEQATNPSLWACATMAAMALVSFKPSQ
jgi:hypothetical protein